jgi:hypothetical protein
MKSETYGEPRPFWIPVLLGLMSLGGPAAVAEVVKACPASEVVALRVVAVGKAVRDSDAAITSFPIVSSSTANYRQQKSFEVVLSVPVRASYTLADALPEFLSADNSVVITCTPDGVMLSAKMIFTPEQQAEEPERYSVELELVPLQPVVTVEAKLWILPTEGAWWKSDAIVGPITKYTESITIRKTVSTNSSSPKSER